MQTCRVNSKSILYEAETWKAPLTFLNCCILECPIFVERCLVWGGSEGGCKTP